MTRRAQLRNRPTLADIRNAAAAARGFKVES